MAYMIRSNTWFTCEMKKIVNIAQEYRGTGIKMKPILTANNWCHNQQMHCSIIYT